MHIAERIALWLLVVGGIAVGPTSYYTADAAEAEMRADLERH